VDFFTWQNKAMTDFHYVKCFYLLNFMNLKKRDFFFLKNKVFRRSLECDSGKDVLHPNEARSDTERPNDLSVIK